MSKRIQKELIHGAQLNLFEDELIHFNNKQTECYITTLDVAKGSGRRHDNIMQIIKRHIKNNSISLLNCKESDYKNKRGRVSKMYQLDRKAFIVVALSFTGADADRFKGEIVDRFMEQEEFLSTNDEWKAQRLEVKEVTKITNKTVQRLSDLLKIEMPDSSSGDRIYLHIQNWVNGVVTGKAVSMDRRTRKEKLASLTIIERMVDEYVTTLLDNGYDATEVKEQVRVFLTQATDIFHKGTA